MSNSPLPTFQEFFVAKFKEWENQQPKKRSFLSAFARWLSKNTIGVEIKQQLANDWYYGKYEPKGDKYLLVLEEKLGEEIYKILNRKKPNAYLQIVNSRWEFIPEDIQKKIAEEAATYEAENELSRVSKVSKRGKARKT